MAPLSKPMTARKHSPKFTISVLATYTCQLASLSHHLDSLPGRQVTVQPVPKTGFHFWLATRDRGGTAMRRGHWLKASGEVPGNLGEYRSCLMGASKANG